MNQQNIESHEKGITIPTIEEIIPTDIKKTNLLDRFKRKFTEIFEENDTAM
jgi:hypothetical protein